MYVAVLDCSERDAMAWWFSFMRRENVKQSSEQGNPALMLANERSRHDHVVATIKKMPFPLHNREFVNRLVCCLDVNGDLLIVCVPVNNVIDYGMNTRTVRGVSRALLWLTPYGESQCKVTYIQYLDACGRIPTFVANAKLLLALDAVGDLREKFQRDDEIDKLERDQLARVIKEEPQTYTAEENLLLIKVNVKLGMIEWERFEELESPDLFVRMGKIFVDGEKDVTIRGVATIDALVRQCAAWDLMKMSREQMKRRSNSERSLVKINEHQSVYRFVRNLHIPSLLPREWIMTSVWKWRDLRTLEIAYEHNPDHELFPKMSSKFMRDGNSSTVHYLLEEMPTSRGVPQTRVTFTQTVNLGGLVPKWAVTRQGGKQLMYLSTMRKQFDKSLEIDCATRAQNVGLIADHMEQYSEEENRILAEGENHFTDFQGMKVKSLKMASPLTTAKIAYKSGGRHAWGRATTTVRARPEEVLAFTWDAMRRSARRDEDLEKSVEERINWHNTLVYVKKRTPKIILDRDFLGRCVWKKEGEGFVLVTSPEESEARPITGSVVRGKYWSALKIKRKNDKETTLEYVINQDAGGSLPGWLMSRYTGSNLAFVTEIQEYFQALRGLEEWDADDARAVGEVMCIKTKAEKHSEKGENKQSARMRVLFKKHLSLCEIGRRYEFFEGMMARVVRSTPKPAGDVKSKLCSVSLTEGETIGRGLAMALACNLTAEAAVDEWVLKYKRSLGELDRTEAWFR